MLIADEAHRSQYDFIDRYARQMRDALPQALFIGFTGISSERDDENTIHVFGGMRTFTTLAKPSRMAQPGRSTTSLASSS